MKRILIAIGAGVVLAVAGCEAVEEGAVEVDERAQQAVDIRQSVLTLMRANFGPLVGIARDEIPYDGPTVQKAAMRLDQLAAMLEDAFRRDTRGTGVETEALDRIWEQPDAFAEKIATLEQRVDLLNQHARAGDEAAVKAAVGDVGKACGSCHDDFRVDDD